jgi:iron complex outermembrane recepter protein
VDLWAKNLENTLYRNTIIPFLGDRFAVFGPPRTYGLRLNWNFN